MPKEYFVSPEDFKPQDSPPKAESLNGHYGIPTLLADEENQPDNSKEQD